MENLVFTQLSIPEVRKLFRQELEEFFTTQKQANQAQQPTDRWLDLTEFCSYDPSKPAKATVYALVSRNEIPHHKKGKKLYFLKSEIDTWLKDGRKKTVSELELEADDFLSTSKRRG